MMVVFAIITLNTVVLPSDAQAQVSTCTDHPFYKVDNDITKAREGILYRVAVRIIVALRATAGNMFNSIVNSRVYFGAVWTALVLSVILYAIFFTLGIVQASFHDAFWRFVKVGFIFTILHPQGWLWFNTYIVSFFDGGTADLTLIASNIAFAPLHGAGAPAINPLTAATTGPGVNVSVVQQMADPLVVFSNGIKMLLSPKMVVMLIAMPFTGPYGLIIFILLAWGLTTFIMAVLQAVWVFLMSLIAKALLYGLAPIFIAFILFDRTKPLFMGWLSQIIHYSLQPILLFTFFMMLLEASLEKILRVRLCWEAFTPLPGFPIDIHFWRFKVPGAAGAGEVTFFDWDTPFPISIVDILIFIIIAQLAFRYISVVLHIAKEISGGVISLNQMPGTIQQWARTLETKTVGAAKNAFMSDVRMKENIRQVGMVNGINLYEFNYKDREGLFRGVLAHEVEHIKGAVIKIKGYKRVNYQKLGVSFVQIG